MSSRLLYKGYYLCEMNAAGDVVSIDGSHKDSKGVTKAKALLERIFNKNFDFKMVNVLDDLEIPKGEEWHNSIDRLVKSEILELEDVLEGKVEVNEEAVQICKSLINGLKNVK